MFHFLCMAVLSWIGTTSNTGFSRILLPPNVEFHDWIWNGQLLVGVERQSSATSVSAFDITGGKLVRRHRASFEGGGSPAFLSKTELCLVDRGRRVVILDADSFTVKKSIDLPKTLLIGEIARQGDALWLYGLENESETSVPEIYRVNVDPPSVTFIGKGYYPRLLSDGSLLSVDRDREYSLIRIDVRDEQGTHRREVLILGSDVFMPQIVAGGGLLVCQRGFRCPRIELLEVDGRVLRCLSGDGRCARLPMLSPSGSYVAYTFECDADTRARVVEVVNLKGELLRQILIGARPLSTAYRWSAEGDQLGVLTMTKEGQLLEIESFP